jgi:cysteinyl-tRNA synthetase
VEPSELPPVALHDTLTRKVSPLSLRQEGKVSVYCCGPTTYDVAHVGHARAAVAFDLLVRVLRHRGLDVTYVRNITDVDDNILARAEKNGEPPTALATRMTDAYRQDMTAVGCARPTHEPKVSEHVPQIVALIEQLIAKGSAYAIANEGKGNDVYFRVRSFPGYGKLSGRNIDDLRSGARVEVDERKEDPLDFALWKGCADAAWGFPSPWGRGRPGWHIECSAMSAQYLGHGHDIHAGGMDLVFPHHENEIAQSEGANPDAGPFARCWLHNGFVNVDRDKMSKSLGNFFTVKDVLARNDAEALRLFLLAHHYRGPVQFEVETLADGRHVFPGVDEAERKVDYLYTTLARIEGQTVTGMGASAVAKEYQPMVDEIGKLEHAAHAALADDLGAAVAIAHLYRLAAIINESLDLLQRRKNDRPSLTRVSYVASRAVMELCEVLGILRAPPARYFARTRQKRLALVGLDEAGIEEKVQARIAARKAKDFARADEIRAELEGLGIELFDNPTGTTWKKAI